jgi:hypothetical protein
MKRLWLAAIFVVGLSIGAVGQGTLSGSLDTTLAFDLSGGSIALLDTSLMSMDVGYEIEGWTFKGTAKLDFAKGISLVGLLANGYLGDIRVDNSVTFYPIGKQESRSSTRTRPSHLYNFSQGYFIDRLEITNVNATDDWYVRVSNDLVDWEVVAGPFPASVHDTGIVAVNLLARYVEVVPVSGLLTSSPTSPEEITITYSRVLLTSRLSYRTPDGMTISTSLSAANSGASYFQIKLDGSRRSKMGFTSTLKFSITRPDCQFQFQRATATLTSAFACVERLAMDVAFDDKGFDAASFSLGQIDIGVDWLALNGRVTFDVDSKTVSLTPELVLLSDTCVSAYGSLVFGETKTEIGGVSIYGLLVEQQVGDATLSSLTYFDAYHFVPVLGDQNCFESLSLSLARDGCCGGSNQLGIVVAFARDSTELFGWAETDLSASFSFGESLSAAVTLMVDRVHNLEIGLEFHVQW